MHLLALRARGLDHALPSPSRHDAGFDQADHQRQCKQRQAYDDRSYSWEVPEALLAGGRAGWSAILSSLKSVLETGKPLSIKLEPPREMMAALQQVVAAKPWLKS